MLQTKLRLYILRFSELYIYATPYRLFSTIAIVENNRLTKAYKTKKMVDRVTY